MLVLFFYFLGMSKVQTPSPHASKKHDKRFDSCQAYVSELDPHPVCLKCVPRECSRELPCSHCASLSLDAWKKWERQQAGRKWHPCLPVSRDASRRAIPQVPKPTSPVIATGVLAVERPFPKSHLLASSPVGGCWARRPCHLLVGPPGVTRVISAT